MKTITRTVFACFVVLALSGCHKEEPVADDEMPTIVWTEYDPEGTRVVAHYSDNSEVFFENYGEGLTCIGNRFADGESPNRNYALESPESIIARTDLEVGEWYFDHHIVYGIDTLPVVAVSGGLFDHRLTNVVFPESLEVIGDYAFDGCSSLTSIVLPNNIRSLDNTAFRGCSSLNTVTILKVSETISERTFSNVFNDASSTLSLIISDGITTICDKAFGGCSMLKSISFPSSIQKVASDAFYGCSSLQKVTIRAGMDAVPEEAYDGVFRKENGITSSSITLFLGDSYRSIGKRAFRNCSSFSNVVFPSELKEVSMAAFSGCSSLTELVFPEGFKTIQGGYFNEFLEYIVEGGAFAGCSSLTNVVLPEGLGSIGEWAFSYCSSLTEIVIPKSVWSISAGAFNGCSSLTNVVFSEGLHVIEGGYDSSNTGCEYEIYGAFKECTSLTNIVFPTDLYSIGVGSFWGCSSLVTCTSYSIVPPRVPVVTTSYVFADDLFNFGGDTTPLQAIYVPRESVEAYKTADGWRNYADIIYPIE